MRVSEDMVALLSPQMVETIALLRDMGWTVLPPPSEAIPAPSAGQVWPSPRPRVEARTVIKVGPRSERHLSHHYVFFTTPTRLPHPKWGPSRLLLSAWTDWARKSDARPVETQL